MAGQLFRSPFQHKLLGYVEAPVSCLPLAMNFEFPIPWQYILQPWEYRLLRLYLCTATRFSLGRGSDFYYLVKHKLPFMWSVCCHDAHENTLEARARRVVVTNLMKELMAGFGFDIKFKFYRKYVNKNLSFRVLYEGSVMFRDIHLIFVKIDYWGDVVRIKRLRLKNAVVCSAFTGDYLVIFCKGCRGLKRSLAKECAFKTRAALWLVARVCDTFTSEPSQYELQRQSDLRRLTNLNACICRWCS